MVPQARFGMLSIGADAPMWQAPSALSGRSVEQFAQPHRPTTGSRKRKAYMPRNSGCDTVSGEVPEQAHTKNRGACSKAARTSPPHTSIEVSCAPGPATGKVSAAPLLRLVAQSTDSLPNSPAAGSSKALSVSPRAPVPEVQRCGSGSSSAAAAPPAAPAVGVTVESLATTRSRRVIKRREKFDPHMFELSGDLDEAEETRSDNSSDTLSRRSCFRKDAAGLVREPASESAAASGAVPSPRAWLSALVSGMPKASGHRASESASGSSDEQRMFQEFRKRTCTAYTGVVVHCQNMKLEARVNMVSYFPQRERKISGGQIYIAYMTNPHQAAVVHDITASIMTAPGIPIYHNHHCRPSANREVALERLNYLDTLAVNMHRGYSRNNDKDQLLERKARLDAENRRQVMLGPEALKRELHCWVSHDSRWMTFKSWIEGVLFESKLANMCLKPKTIDSSYLRPEEQELLNHWAPEFSMANPHVFTHMYDTLVMDKIIDSCGKVCGYKLRSKRYRRRKPEVRNGAVKWFDDKSYRCDLEDAPTEEDQQRVDIAWQVVCRWLRHYDPALQGPPPDYDAVDANYYVTWGHFADWVNTMLEHMPQEIESLQKDASSGAAERSTSTRRSARNGDGQAVKDRIRRLQAVHDKFRAVVAEGETMPSTWSQAKPEHRRAFENFFSGWKPLPPSMSQLQRRAVTRAAGDCGYKSSRRTASARTDAAPQTRSACATRSQQPARDSCPSAASAPSASAFTNVSAAATTGTTCADVATVDAHATPTSPVLPQEGTPARSGEAAALKAAASVSAAMQQSSMPPSVALPHPLLPLSCRNSSDLSLRSVLPLVPNRDNFMHTSVRGSAPQHSAAAQHPRLTVASLSGSFSGTLTSAAGSRAPVYPNQGQSLPQQKLDVATGVLASMAGINDAAGLQAWATLHGLSSAVPTVLPGPAAPHSSLMHSTHLPQVWPAQGGSGDAAPVAASAQTPLVQSCDLQHLMQAQVQPPTARPQLHTQNRCEEQPQQQQVCLKDALSALDLPFGLLTQKLQHLPHCSAPEPTSSPGKGTLASGSAQLAPRAVQLPPSPFLTALENPKKRPTADSLFQGAPAMPPLLTCMSEPTNSGMNDSSRSCLTSGPAAGCVGAGGKSNSTNSGAPADSSSHAATTETAVHHPTLSSLLSNPLFALPRTAQAARAGGSDGTSSAMQSARGTISYTK